MRNKVTVLYLALTLVAFAFVGSYRHFQKNAANLPEVVVTTPAYDPSGFKVYEFSTATPAPTETPLEESKSTEESTIEAATPTAIPTPAPIPVPENLFFGVYDPENWHTGNEDVIVQHEYISWLELPGKTYSVTTRMLESGRIPMISLAPYPWEDNPFEPQWIVDGWYDPHIVGHCQAMNIPGQPILVRWAHEMDLSADHPVFPWVGKDPKLMVEAFRHFADVCRKEAPNVQIVWSPAGMAGLDNYYPGDEYVDFVGLTVLSNQLINGRENGKGAFRELFGTRYNLIAGYNKPVIMAEFSAAGESEYVETYFREAYAGFEEYPLLQGVVLFNFHQTDDAWGEGIHPDFRMSAENFPPR